MNVKKKTLIPVLILLGIAIISLAYLGITQLFGQKKLNILCISSYTAPVLPENMNVRGTVSIYLGENNKGSFNVSGLLDTNDKSKMQKDTKQIVLREVLFDYRVDNDKFITIYNTKIHHNALDHISDDFFNQHIFDLSRPSLQIKIMRVNNNTWLFGTLFSPVLMCVNKT